MRTKYRDNATHEDSLPERFRACLLTITQIHRIVHKGQSYENLARIICRHLAKNMNYEAVWVALMDMPQGTTQVGSFGHDDGFCQIYNNLKHGKLKDCVKRALKKAGLVFIVTPVYDCAGCTTSKSCKVRGAATLRIRYGSKTYGVLSISGGSVLIEDQDEQIMIRELAQNIAFALHKRKHCEKWQQSYATLAENEEFTSKLLEHSPNPILVINPDTSIKYVNPALENLTGFSRKELIGSKPPYAFWTEETLEDTFSDLFAFMDSGAMGNRELFKRKDGSRFWVKINSIAVKGNGQLKYYLSSWVDITLQKQLRESMQFYITEITKAQEEERNRMARDLHDDTCQKVASLYDYVDKLLSMTNDSETDTVNTLEYLRGRIDVILEDLREFSHKLRPPLLERMGLVAALESLVEDATKGTEINHRLEVVGSERRLSDDTELGLFRIIQEALNNVRKHSKATETEVTVEFGKRKVKVKITDNGVGFRLADRPGLLAYFGRMGLMSMRERAISLKGTLSIRSDLGKGTGIEVEI